MSVLESASMVDNGSVYISISACIDKISLGLNAAMDM